ncbi:hypothetical protein QC281_00185 [Streptomyces sp. DH17]|nr:hypothetical protein [Streptomyces sp. DH17]
MAALWNRVACSPPAAGHVNWLTRLWRKLSARREHPSRDGGEMTHVVASAHRHTPFEGDGTQQPTVRRFCRFLTMVGSKEPSWSQVTFTCIGPTPV